MLMLLILSLICPDTNQRKTFLHHQLNESMKVPVTKKKTKQCNVYSLRCWNHPAMFEYFTMPEQVCMHNGL